MVDVGAGAGFPGIVTKIYKPELELTLMEPSLWEAIDWTWFRKNGEDVLYWHWSPDYGFEKNHT